MTHLDLRPARTAGGYEFTALVSVTGAGCLPTRDHDFSAVDHDRYDGPPCPVGYGATPEAAIADLVLILEGDEE